MIQPTTNLNPLSADPSSRQKPNKSGLSQASPAFKKDLDDHLAQAGGIDGAQTNLAAQLAMAAAQAQSQPATSRGVGAGGIGPQAQKANHEGALSGQAVNQNLSARIQRPGRESIAEMDTADFVPRTARVASGVEAGSSIAGLKPWNQDWVFEGSPTAPGSQAAEPRPLFGPSNREVAIAQLQEALGQLGQIAGSPAGKTAQGQATPNSMMIQGQTRGDQDIAALLALKAAAAAQANPAERMQMAQVHGAIAGNLAQQLRSMNGQMGEVKPNGTGKLGENRKLALANSQLAQGSGMSGADFMSALQRVRPDHAAGVNPADGAERGSMQQEFSSGGMNARPELKVIDGAKKDSSQEFVMSASPASMSAMHSHQSSQLAPQQPVAQVTGHVVQGSMAQDQLSHEALLGVSTGIQNMSAQGGGEMRIRLRPENLGELHLKIVTQGNDVGIQIQASDEKAKKILEGSLSSLKDSLAQQNLTLGKVEFSVAQATGGHGLHNESSNQQQQSSSQQNYFQSALGQNAGDNRNQGQARHGQWASPEGDAFGAKPLKSAAALGAASGSAGSASANARTASGRLDVLA